MKPGQVTYGVEDSPPMSALLLLGVQHLFGNVAGWVLMAGICASFAATVPETASMLRMGMIVVGVGAILQALPRGPVGAGVLCPPSAHPLTLRPTCWLARITGCPRCSA